MDKMALKAGRSMDEMQDLCGSLMVQRVRYGELGSVDGARRRYSFPAGNA